jgi:O-methyltransferase
MQLLRTLFSAMGVEVRRVSSARIPPVEFSQSDLDVYRAILDSKLTMVSAQGLAATILACKHAVRAGIEGDFVECGVWRGGISIAAKMTFESYGSDKKVWLFDTFAGMTEPTSVDHGIFTGEDGTKLFGKHRRNDHVDWCYASLEDVSRSFERSGVNVDGVRFVKGDVSQTLRDERNLPAAISVLRLDTDFYESTKAELEVLYPLLSKSGSILIDDFGYWEGARMAVEEYFDEMQPSDRPLLIPLDRCGRAGVKS